MGRYDNLDLVKDFPWTWGNLAAGFPELVEWVTEHYHVSLDSFVHRDDYERYRAEYEKENGPIIDVLRYPTKEEWDARPLGFKQTYLSFGAGEK